MIRTMIGLAAAVAVLGGTATPATATPAAAGTSLTLTYADKKVRLTCGPTNGGGHPKADEACALLREAGGDPARMRSGDAICILLYQPVTARLTGTWRGRAVKWQRTYGNTCEMGRATGVLFQF